MMPRDTLLELDEKVATGGEAVCFWVTEPAKTAEVRFADGTAVGPFLFGQTWGPDADPDLSGKLAGRLFRLGLMDPALDEAQAWSMLTDRLTHRVINQVFPCDLAAILGE